MKLQIHIFIYVFIELLSPGALSARGGKEEGGISSCKKNGDKNKN